MTDKPILFSGPMVLALLREAERPGTGKTQTRRLPKVRTPDGKSAPITSPDEELIELEPGDFRRGVFHYRSTGGLSGPWPLRFAVGDRLWVRETFTTCNDGSVAVPKMRALYGSDFAGFNKPDRDWNWTGGTRMPRWASRLTLTVTDVRVQRLQEISEADAIAEGASSRPNCTGFQDRGDGWAMDWSRVGKPSKWADNGKLLTEKDIALVTARFAFGNLWDEINGAGSWAENPFVVAVTFTVERRNIDT